MPADLSQLRDITGIEELPPPPPGPNWLPWAIAAALAAAMIVALAGVWLVLRCRRRREVELPPEQWALAELDRIDALGLPAAGQVERYHTLVSDIVRRYVERRFGLRAPEQTTPEFLEALRQSELFPPPQQEQLRDFLERCDLAKFARAAFSEPECQALGRLARALVTETAQLEPIHSRNRARAFSSKISS